MDDFFIFPATGIRTDDAGNRTETPYSIGLVRTDDGELRFLVSPSGDEGSFQTIKFSAAAANIIAARLITAHNQTEYPKEGTIGLCDEFGGDKVFVRWNISETDEAINVGEWAVRIAQFIQNTAR
jgi:hypothetical protein